MKLTVKVIETNIEGEKHTLNLRGVYFTSWKLVRTDIQLMCHYLKGNTDITTLNVGHNHNKEEGAKTLAFNTTLISDTNHRI